MTINNSYVTLYHAGPGSESSIWVKGSPHNCSAPLHESSGVLFFGGGGYSGKLLDRLCVMLSMTHALHTHTRIHEKYPIAYLWIWMRIWVQIKRMTHCLCKTYIYDFIQTAQTEEVPHKALHTVHNWHDHLKVRLFDSFPAWCSISLNFLSVVHARG